MTIDAMENIGPEDWPVVLANLHRAVRRGGHLYLTVEEIDITEIDRAFSESTARGLPAIHGEVIEGDTAGYHYYPGRDQVMSRLGAEELDVVDERFDQEDDWGYRHLFLRSRHAWKASNASRSSSTARRSLVDSSWNGSSTIRPSLRDHAPATTPSTR